MSEAVDFRDVEKKVFSFGAVLFFLGAITGIVNNIVDFTIPLTGVACYVGLAICFVISSIDYPKKKRLKKTTLGVTLTISFFLSTLLTVTGAVMEINELVLGKWIVYFCLIPFSCYLIWYSIVNLELDKDFKSKFASSKPKDEKPKDEKSKDKKAEDEKPKDEKPKDKKAEVEKPKDEKSKDEKPKHKSPEDEIQELKYEVLKLKTENKKLKEEIQKFKDSENQKSKTENQKPVDENNQKSKIENQKSVDENNQKSKIENQKLKDENNQKSKIENQKLKDEQA